MHDHSTPRGDGRTDTGESCCATASHSASANPDGCGSHPAPGHRPGHGPAHGHDPARHREHAAGHDHGHAAHGGGHCGNGDHAGHDPDLFRRRFWLSLLLTLPVVYWSGHIQDLLGYRALDIPGARWIPAVLGIAVFFYGGWVFLTTALDELRARLPGMMTLIALAISVAFLFSLAVEFGWIASEPLWWELATLVTIMLLGHWIEMRSIAQAHGALDELARLLPDTALLVHGEGSEERTEEVPLGALRDGDIVLVRPGASVPADGIVRRGNSELDESLLTGESRPVTRGTGDPVIAGTLNGSGSLRVEVTGTGESTVLSGIVRLVSEAQHSRSRAQHLADRAARWLTWVSLSAALVTFIAWRFAGAELDFTIVRVVTVLVIACPHALGLAIPLVVAISTTLGARNGLLVRDRRGLEEARRLDAVVFDKTGTLTRGEHRVVAMATAQGVPEDDALRVAAAAELDSEHPLARGLVASARDRGLSLPAATEFRAEAGVGVFATVDGAPVAVGGPGLLRQAGVSPEPALAAVAAAAADRGETVLYLLAGGEVQALFAVADALRPESREAVERLQAQGIEVVMLTGDSRAVADAVAAQLGIEQVVAEVLPGDKAAVVRELRAQGKRVAMIGDGVNDAPALASADLGVAIGAGADVAVEAGHVVLVRSDPRDIPRLLALARATYRKMVQNLWWAAGYNILAIPLAAGALVSRGIVLSPALGAVLMSVSTIVVALNAQLLKRLQL